MSRQLQGLLNIATSKAKDEPKAGEPVKNKVQTYFDIQRGKMAADPTNTYHASAVAAGKIGASLFLDKVKNSSHPEHDKAMRILKNDYEMDFGKAEQGFIDQAVNDMDSHPYEKEDQAFESRTINAYKPVEEASVAQHHMFANFKDAAKNLWNKSGYRANTKAIDSLAAKYGLTKKVENHIDDTDNKASASLLNELRNKVRNKK